jgi:hypothetical protein
MPTIHPTLARPTGALATLALALLLGACNGAKLGDQAPTEALAVRAWSEDELAAVLDLRELGATLQPSEDGEHLLLGGRPLPPEVLEANPHLAMGRSINLLRFAPELLEALSPEARAFIDLADANLLRDRLAEYGLTIAQVRDAWGSEGEVSLEQLLALAAELDAKPGIQTAATESTGLGLGSLLLLDLGVSP